MRNPFSRSKSDGDAAAPVGDAAAAEAARTRARRRLFGALVLLAIGVVGFPLLFETQPRPLPVDTPMLLAQHDGARGMPAAPLQVTPSPAEPMAAGTPAAVAQSSVAPVETPPTAEKSAPSAERAAPPAEKIAPPAAVAPAPVVTPPATTARTEPPPQPKPAPAAPATPPTSKPHPAAPADDGARARALLEGAAPVAATPGRFVVQVGAYSDASKLHEARAKVEALGYKTYTQVVETDAGKRTRVRVGPYATHEQANAVAAKVKHSGLPAAILAL
ncbi:MAG: SPOR domain-containing protein [Burkholderiales bacterium]|nr:SPOR domain-containing protein [Burkholderiales bacterium]